MSNQQITIQPLSSTDIPLITELIIAQESYHHHLDPRLPIRSRSHIELLLAQQCRDTRHATFVAHNTAGKVRGYAQAGLWKLPPESEMLAFFTPRNGVIQTMALPPQTSEDAQEVTVALLDALKNYWQSRHTLSDILRWPSHALWFTSTLQEHSFILDSVLAYYPPQPLLPVPSSTSSQLRARPARPQDEEVLVDLLRETFLAHKPYTPFVRTSPTIEQAFRTRLTSLWAGGSFTDGAPLVVVVEREGEIVAMAENTLTVIPDDGNDPFLPPGRYGYINNVGVRQDVRGQGIGHLLVQAVFDAFTTAVLDGYMLWYNPDNPLARRFWTRLGFQPLWTTYQHPHNDKQAND